MAVAVFILALLGLSCYVWEKQKQAEEQAAYEAERHLVVYSAMPDDVNRGWPTNFIKRRAGACRCRPARTGRSDGS